MNLEDKIKHYKNSIEVCKEKIEVEGPHGSKPWINIKEECEIKLKESMELQKTIEFATKAHGDQKRKYTGEPYIVHPISVMKRIEKLGIAGDILHAAILHDVVEDTPITLEEIRSEFGESISSIVEELTDVYTSAKFPELNRKARKKLEIERLSKISEQAQTIKLSDIIDNLPSIMEGDPGFGRVYIKEKIGILSVLTKGDERLKKEASELIKKYELF